MNYQPDLLRRNRRRTGGFTIVEVLVTVVVITILAVISANIFSGIQDRSRASTAEANARAIAGKTLAYYNINTAFPSTVNELKTGTGEAALDTNAKNTIQTNQPEAATYDKVQYRYCDGGRGAQIIWWNSSTKTLETIQLKSASGCVNVAS